MTGSLALAGGLLSACGVGLLVLDAQYGVGGWVNVWWQVAGCGAGLACFVGIARRAWRCGRHFPRAAPSFTGALLLVPRVESLDFGIDRPLLAEVVRFTAVILVGTLVLWRSYRRGSDEIPTTADLWVVLVPAFALTFCALVLGSLSGALVILVVTAIMLRAAGYSRGDALLLVLVPIVLLWFLVLSSPYRGLRLADSLRHTITMRLHTPERTLVGLLMQHRGFGLSRKSQWFDLSPRVARQLAIVTVVAVAGYPGALVVALPFGVIAWIGFRRARDAATLAQRMMVAGMTATLVVPAALHMVGCLALLSAQAGPLPFVSYGPGELVLAWTALGFVAAGKRSNLGGVSINT